MPPGSEASRGRGGKFNKAKRGGGKHFSRNLTPLDADGNPVSMWADPRDVQTGDDSEDDSDDSDESSDDEDSDDEAKQEMTREERRAAAKARKEAAIAKKQQRAAEPGDLPPSSSEGEEKEDTRNTKGGGMPANPNHTAKSKAQAAGSSTQDKPELSRREREALQAQQAREKYQKLHAEGKTDEARADLARLKLIREQREAAAARKMAEKEEKDAAEERRIAEMTEKERKKREAAMGPAAKKGSKKAAKG